MCGSVLLCAARATKGGMAEALQNGLTFSSLAIRAMPERIDKALRALGPVVAPEP